MPANISAHQHDGTEQRVGQPFLVTPTALNERGNFTGCALRNRIAHIYNL
jgi:hypothetical protein